MTKRPPRRWTRRRRLPPLAACHLRQALAGTLWAFGLLVGLNGLALYLGGPEVPATWVFVLLYFATVHSALVLFGMFGLARAMAGQPYRYPVVGVDCPGSEIAAGHG